jgi:hypothetical protein
VAVTRAGMWVAVGGGGVAVGRLTTGVGVPADGSGSGVGTLVHVGRGVHVAVGSEMACVDVGVGRGGIVWACGARPGSAQSRPSTAASNRVARAADHASCLRSFDGRDIRDTGCSPSLCSNLGKMGGQQRKVSNVHLAIAIKVSPLVIGGVACRSAIGRT